jgi:predicted DNA-binding transcriptional regulator AlpA
MIGYIYLSITADERYYIGQHKTKEFDPKYKGSGKLLKSNIVVECKMIDQADTIEELNAKEKYWIYRCASKTGSKCLNLGLRSSIGSQLVYVNLKTKEAYYDVSVVAKKYGISKSTVDRWINRFGSYPKAWKKSKSKNLKKYHRELMYQWVAMSIEDYLKVKDFNIK